MARSWLSVIRRYLAGIALLNLAWEAAHMPLYDLWSTGTLGQIVFYGLHCTVGDVLIALSALMIALMLFGTAAWPADRYGRVAAVATALGFAYTAGSEWYNVRIADGWSYADAMPLVFGIGLTPLLQWLIVPPAVFWWARR